MASSTARPAAAAWRAGRCGRSRFRRTRRPRETGHQSTSGLPTSRACPRQAGGYRAVVPNFPFLLNDFVVEANTILGGADRTLRWFPPHVYTVLLGKGFNVMLKKILIAAVAVIAGLAVLTKVTKISPMVWFGDCCHPCPQHGAAGSSAQAAQRPRSTTSTRTSRRTSAGWRAWKSRSRCSRTQLDAKRDHQAKLRADIGDMQKSLEARTEKVAYHGHSSAPRS